MLRLVRFPASRLFLSFVLSLSLIYGPPMALRPARAESSSPSKNVRPVQPITKPHKPGEVIIKFKQDVPKQVRDQIIQVYAKEEKELRGRSRASRLKIKDHLDLANTVFELKQMDAVIEFAEPNYLVMRAGSFGSIAKSSKRMKRPRRSAQPPTTPDDPQFGLQRALNNAGQSGGVPGSDIGTVTGGQKTTGDHDTVIAVIDSGIEQQPDPEDHGQR